MALLFPAVFLTVGTTEFDELIAVLDQSTGFVDALVGVGCRRFTVQVGRGVFPEGLVRACEQRGIACECYRFKPDLVHDMHAADLVISHCGAGSILEAMTLRKPLIVAVNSTLQGNHQTELSDALAADGHCLSTTPRALPSVLARLAAHEVALDTFCRPFPDARTDLFPAAVDKLLGFS
jgi:beta-1,4-N-acetylglucosaminyltransferase